MGSMTNEARRVFLVVLHNMQDGKCCYCGGYMPLGKREGGPPEHGGIATFEHLDDRYDMPRGQVPFGKFRRVALACWDCKQERGKRRSKKYGVITKR